MGADPALTFSAELWLWDARRADTWIFVTVPEEITSEIDDAAELRGLRKGFGSVRVKVRIASSVWRTSVFPDKRSGCFVLPIKAAVRKAEGLAVGDSVQVWLEVID